MRKVYKGPEPSSLTQYRGNGGTRWDDYRDKQAAREALATEQSRICAFCQGRIRPNEGGMKIAHVVPQSDPDEGVQLCLQWGNLVGSCKGGEGQPERHCDTLQGSRRIPALLHPVNFQTSTIKYTASGQITSDNQTIKNAINNVLGLNAERLTQNRRAALDAVKRDLGPAQTWNAGRIATYIRRLEDPRQTELPAYVDYLLWWLKKRSR